jgi:hypothetical protein
LEITKVNKQNNVLRSHRRWQSFYRGGSVAFYVALYAVGFLGSSLHNLSGFLPTLTYLSYMSIMILALYTAMGTVRPAAEPMLQAPSDSTVLAYILQRLPWPVVNLLLTACQAQLSATHLHIK